MKNAAGPLLRGDLDELLEQLHPLVERHAHEHLRHHPLLHLVAALQQHGQRPRLARTGSVAEGVVHQLLLQGATSEENVKRDLFLLSDYYHYYYFIFFKHSHGWG